MLRAYRSVTIRDWGLGTGDWGLGTGNGIRDRCLIISLIPNP